MKYYDGTKLLNLKDVHGNVPEIFMCTSNRSAGKTTWFMKKLINDFINDGKKFVILYRFNYELGQCSDKIFTVVHSLFFKEYEMKDEIDKDGVYSNLFIKKINDEEWKHCGFAMALNKADPIKKMSSLFSEASCCLFDEFQSETGKYCTNELTKFHSLHASLARGEGKQVKYFPVYMLSNEVSIINPYYSALGIDNRLMENTKFLKGDGWVLEKNYNESAAKQNQESAFNRAFASSHYSNYLNGSFLNDSSNFIEQPSGYNKYLFTLVYRNVEYGVREYTTQGFLYVSKKADATYPTKIAVDLESHQINYVLLTHYDSAIRKLKWMFDHGSFRFQNIQCRNALMALLHYRTT